MAFSKRKQMAVVSGGILFVALIFYIVAQADSSWFVGKGAFSNYKFGLWTVGQCNGKGCEKLNAARAFLIMATIAAAIGAALMFYLAFQGYSNVIWMAAVVAALLTFLFGMIGWAIGIDIVVKGGLTLGAASILGLIAWLISIVATIGGFLISRQPE